MKRGSERGGSVDGSVEVNVGGEFVIGRIKGEFVMEKLIIHTNKIVANKGTRLKDVTESITTPVVDNTKILCEISHKLDIILKRLEESSGKTDN
ncbi:hypothetical protein [Gardnerella sp. DNF01162]|nr:hypothetical protein [Gardnerella sp. DNF01162]DAY24276.1 MAG TPA: hypothetical protein [Caudoviricetes sp.]